MRPDSERQTFFIHVPKAAGTSFISFLCSHFEEARIVKGAYWESIRKQPIEVLRHFDLIAGHIGYELAFHLRDPFLITVLRDPVDRLCSVYEFLRELYERDPGQTFPDPDVNELVQLWKVVVRRPLEAFLESPEAPVRAALLENPQARQLAQSTPYLLTDLSEEDLRRLALSRLKRRPSFLATAPVVPVPKKGSSTTSPGSVVPTRTRCSSASGFCVGCALPPEAAFSRSLPVQIGSIQSERICRSSFAVFKAV